MVLGDGSNHEINLFFVEVGVRGGREIRRRSLNSTNDGRRRTIGRRCLGRQGVASNLAGIFDECCGELCQRELERESAVMAGAFVAFDQAADFRTPFRSQIADGKVESIRFGVRARGLSLANHEVLKSANVETKWLRPPLPGNLAGG